MEKSHPVGSFSCSQLDAWNTIWEVWAVFYYILNIFNVYSLAIWTCDLVVHLRLQQCREACRSSSPSMFHLWMMTRAHCKANPIAPITSNYATMPPSTPWSTTKVQTQGNHEVMTYSTLQRREQRPHTVSLGKGGRRIAAKSQSFANATGYCVHRDGEFTTRSNYAFMNFSFTRVWKPSQKPKRFNLIEVRTNAQQLLQDLPTWASLLVKFIWIHSLCHSAQKFSIHSAESQYQGSCRTIQLIEMMEPVWFSQLFMTMFCVLPALLK